MLNRLFAVLSAALIAIPGAAFAQVIGEPKQWGIGLQPEGSPVKEQVGSLHNLLLVIIFAISIFVLLLLMYTVWRFHAKRNPVPSTTTHNTMLEVIWFTIPLIILIVIAIPSIRLLYFMDKPVRAEMTIKAIGKQWFWTYEYPDYGNFTFDAYMVADKDLKPGMRRLLETDNRVVLPVNTTIRILVTANDVLHSWAVPSFGIKQDATPGHLNETWALIKEEGVYYGQCSELCGVNHGFMPIQIEAVSKERFAEWVKEAQKKFAKVDGDEPAKLAAR
ncbi:MAG: cytochrome c oxidase subunit II [Dongiaceae bacterium]